jgi:hypothetical protein
MDETFLILNRISQNRNTEQKIWNNSAVTRVESFNILTYGIETIKHVFQVILIHFLLISTESKIF